MHGAILRSFEGFLRNVYGDAPWAETMAELDAGIESFEPMFHYDNALAARILAAVSARLDKPPDALLEDFGTYLVTHPASERMRRLLRFGGVKYEDFLISLEDLSGRARLAMPDLDLPDVELKDEGNGRYVLSFKPEPAGVAPVLLGLLRALADDYGALVLVDYADPETAGNPNATALMVQLLEADFAEGRGFHLAEGVKASQWETHP